MELRMRHVLRHMRCACRMAHQNDAIRIAAAGRDVLAHPFQGRLDVLLGSGPGVGRGQAVSHVDADHALAECPKHDVVVKGAVTGTPLAAHEAAAVHKHQHRLAGLPGGGCEHIQQVACVSAIALIAAHLHTGIGFALRQRAVEFFGRRGGYHAADLRQTLGQRGRDLRRHLHHRSGWTGGTARDSERQKQSQ